MPSQIGSPAAVLERAALRPDGKLEIPRVGRDLGESVVALAKLKVRWPLQRSDLAERILGLLKVFSRFEDREQLGDARHAGKLARSRDEEQCARCHHEEDRQRPGSYSVLSDAAHVLTAGSQLPVPLAGEHRIEEGCGAIEGRCQVGLEINLLGETAVGRGPLGRRCWEAPEEAPGGRASRRCASAPRSVLRLRAPESPR